MIFTIEKTNLLGETIPDAQVEQLRTIAFELNNAFESIGIIVNHQVRITNNPNADSPIYFSSACSKSIDVDLIALNCESYSYWCQVIFQLSHELTHFAIDKMCCSRKVPIKWVEETICEAVSLYMLNWFCINWSFTSLYPISPNYAPSIRHYLDHELNKPRTCQLSRIKTYDDLLFIDKNSETHREFRRNERNVLSFLINQYTALGLINYRQFVLEGTILLDSSSYCSRYADNSAVSFLCSLQKLDSSI